MNVPHSRVIVFTAFLAVTQLIACQAPESPGEEATGDSRDSSGMHITVETVASLPANAHLRLVASEYDDVIVFDSSRGPIDFARVELVTGEQQIPMSRWLQSAAREAGVEVQTLEAGVLTVKVTADAATLVSWKGTGPQQQVRCSEPTCCDLGYCCLYMDCNPRTGICTCALVGCCTGPASIQ